MSSKVLSSHPELPLPVLLCAVSTARRMRLRLDECGRLIKVTHPRGVRASAALAWAATHKAWIERQIGRVLPAEPFRDGALIPLEGAEVELRWLQGARRVPQLADGILSCGGPGEGFARRIELFLKRLALDRLSGETTELAGQAGCRPLAVAIGDASTRWGSCSSSGRIRYSWRLILAPPEACRYVVAHEVAHLKHLNHGPEFYELERALFGGDTAAAKALLRSTGPRLRRIGVGR